MNKNKMSTTVIYYCLFLFFSSTLFGCLKLTPNIKEKKVINIQKSRIHNLEKELSKKNRQLDKLKAQRWVGARRNSKKNFRKIKKLFSQGQLVQALRKSAQLKKKYPQSKQLRKLRVMIFQKMGLKRQAQQEALRLKKMVSRKTSRNKRRM